MKIGIVFRPGNLWIGAHWSRQNKRLCVTLLPMVTVWMVRKGGLTPRQSIARQRWADRLYEELSDPRLSDRIASKIKLNLIDEPHRMQEAMAKRMNPQPPEPDPAA